MIEASTLEWLKAVGTPLATLLGFFVVAAQARRTFLYQKAAEKRLAWYEEATASISRLSDAVTYLDVAKADQRKDAWVEFEAASKQFFTVTTNAWLYAGRAGFHAIHELYDILREVLADVMEHGAAAGFTEERVSEIEKRAGDIEVILSIDLREQFAMESLRPSPRLRKKVKEYRRLRGSD